MALLHLTTPASKPKMVSFCPNRPSTSMSSSLKTVTLLPSSLNRFTRIRAVISTGGRRRSWAVGMAPDEEKMTRRSPLDFPLEWERPRPGRRPDIFPQFSPQKTPLPPPMPADDPPLEEEEEEEEEEEKEEEEKDPDNPDIPE